MGIQLNTIGYCKFSFVATKITLDGRPPRDACLAYNIAGGPVKLDSMWQHRLTRLVPRPLHVQHTYYRIIFKQNPFNIISREVQGCTSTDFRLK